MSADVAGTYVFTLTVTDDEDNISEPDSLTVEVDTRSDNEDPVAEAGDDQESAEEITCTPIRYGVDS